MKRPSRENKSSADKVADELASLFHFEEEDASESLEQVPSKLSQSEAKVEPKHKPKLSQEPEPKKLKRPKVEPQPEPKVEPFISQSEAKVEPNASIEALVGLQRKALFFIYESCRLSGSKISSPITIQNLSESAETTVPAGRKAIQRLEQKGFIRRSQFKDGRGGWTKYELSDSIYNQLLFGETRAKVEPNLSQTRAKVKPQPEPQPEPRVSSSSSSLSSYLLEKELTTTATGLSGEWSSIQTPDALKAVGFGTNQLKQILTAGQLSAEQVQRSLNQFSYDLTQGIVKPKTGPLNLIMGILRKGSTYESSQHDNERDAEINAFVERKKRLETAEAEMLKEKRDLEFREWLIGLPQDQKNKLAPPSTVAPTGSNAQNFLLRKYYEDHVLAQSVIEDDPETIRNLISKDLSGNA